MSNTREWLILSVKTAGCWRDSPGQNSVVSATPATPAPITQKKCCDSLLGGPTYSLIRLPSPTRVPWVVPAGTTSGTKVHATTTSMDSHIFSV